MDFFEHQERARRSTGVLITLFVIAVVLICVSVYVATVLILQFTGVWPAVEGAAAGGAVGAGNRVADVGEQFATGRGVAAFFEPRLMAIVGIGTVGLVCGASLWKLAELRAGGSAIAERLGGRLVRREGADADEAKLLNVVEEMAIASGVPTPPVYVMNRERGINAFAAGFTPSDAVIGVTRGCIQGLSRDELQGVIAHEFSHILNGDMRMNLRLIGWLHGILVIGLVGSLLLRGVYYSGAAYSGRRSNREGGGGAVLAAIGIGLALTVIGFVGSFFGTLIKAMVSRQREFLADASAVQFTRNPGGIAGALKKIGGHPRHAALESPNAGEASHMYFEEGVSGISGLFATHPPLRERIRRIDPSWDGKFVKPEIPETPARGPAVAGRGSGRVAGQTPEERRAIAMAMLQAAGHVEATGGSGAAAFRQAPSRFAGTVARPGPEHVERSRELLAAMPPVMREEAEEPFGAQAVVLALLLSAPGQVWEAQLDAVRGLLGPEAARLAQRLGDVARGMDDALRLPLIDVALSALRSLSPGQYDAFRQAVEAVIGADAKVDLFEWTVRGVVVHHLDRHYRRVPPPRVRYYALPRLANEVAAVLYVLAMVGHRDEEARARAFAAGVRAVGMDLRAPETPPALPEIERALDELRDTAPKPKRALIEACAAVVLADERVTAREAEVLRAVADRLGCPTPPIVASP